MMNLRSLRIPKVYCSSLRKVGQYKRPQLNIVPQDKLDFLKTSIFQDRTKLSTSEWKEVQETLVNSYKHINNNNVDSIVLGICNDGRWLPLAKDYVSYLRLNGVGPNASTLGRLLRVYNLAYHSRGGNDTALTERERQEILEIYQELKKRYEIFDATTCESLIQGLVATSEWRTATELLDMIKLTCTPSVTAYTELATKAFDMGDMELGWELISEMVEQRKQPKCEVFIAYLKAIAANSNSFWNNFERFLMFLGKHELIITEKVVNSMEEVISKMSSMKAYTTQTTLTRLGKCNNCGTHMRNISISDAEFSQLRDEFLNKVLIRRDVFQKSTPEEVEHFKRFVEKTAPYDCVIDGLNVAYSSGTKKPPKIFANLLAAVVKYFNEKNKHVLILGRKHMISWPKTPMQFVRNNAAVFLTNNLSHDDPFLLYATLKSGQSTDFFSRDLMRSHAHLLGSQLKTLFRRWQQEHQYALVTQTDQGRIIVKEPIRHLIYAHSVGRTWHLPFKDEYVPNPPEIFDVSKRWLCIKFQK